MNKNKKYILIALLASLLFTVTIGFSVWIILSEQASSKHGFILPKQEPTSVSVVETSQAIYAGETPTFTVTYTYTRDGNTWTVPCDVTVSSTLNTSYTTQPKDATSAGKANVTVTVTPKSWAAQLLFETVTVENVSISILPVAYIGSTYYTTIDAALSTVANATTATTVNVIPSGDYNVETVRAAAAKTITQNFTIKPSVTLRLSNGVTAAVGGTINVRPDIATEKTYDFTRVDDGAKDGLFLIYSQFSGVGTHSDAYFRTDWCENIVTVKSGVTLTNNGTITIDAVVTGAAGGAPYSSIVFGNYSKISMQSGGKITNTGTINCYGFIDEATPDYDYTDNATITDATVQLDMQAGTLNTVLTISEHRGGNVFMGMVNPSDSAITNAAHIGFLTWPTIDENKVYSPQMTTFAFHRFFIQSVSVNTKMSASALMKGEVSMYANEGPNQAMVSFLGTSSALPLFSLSGADSYATFKYTHNTDAEKRKFDLDLYGNSALNPLRLRLTIKKEVASIGFVILVIEMKTAGTLMPISHYYDVSFNRIGTATATVDLTQQELKILPGGSLTIGQGVTANTKRIAIYESNKLLNGLDKSGLTQTDPANSGTFSSYGIAQGLEYKNLAAGKLTVNGTLNATAVGGPVLAGTDNAVLNITSGNTVISPELLHTYDATMTLMSVYEQAYAASYFSTDADSTLTAKGDKWNVGAVKITNATLTTGQYVAKSGAWATPTSVKVSYESNGGSAVAAQTFTVNSYDGLTLSNLPAPTRTYYTFAGWFTDSALQNAANGVVVHTDITLYAKWTENPYNINWKVTIDGEVVEGEGGTLTTESFTIPNDTVAAEVLTTPSITDRTEDDLQFVGWSLIPDGATSGFSFAKSYLANGTTKNANGVYERTIYAVWKSVSYYPTFDFLNNPYNTTLTNSGAEAVGKYYPDTSKIIAAEALGYDTAFDKPYYFEGWYVKVGDGYVKYETTSTLADYADAEGKVTLYANWAPKTYVLTLTGEAAVDKVHHAVDGKSIYFNAAQMSTDLLAEFSANASAAKGSDSTTTVQKYFGGWSISLADAQNSAKYTTDYTENGYTFKQQTFSANWTPKYALTISGSSGGNTAISFNETLYLLDSQVNSSTLSGYDTTAMQYDSNLNVNKYFLNWTYGSTDISKLSTLTTSAFTNKSLTVTAKWGDKCAFKVEVMKATVTLNDNSEYKVTNSSASSRVSKDFYVKPGETVSYKIEFGSRKNTYYGWVAYNTTVEGSNGLTNANGQAVSGSKAISANKANQLFASSETQICLAAGTEVLLADGTVKKIEDVLPTDKLLVFDHETGTLVAGEIMLIETHNGWGYYDILNLRFSNGTVTRVINEHGFFNKTLGKYVYITDATYAEYIGHEFVVVENGLIETVVLEEAFVTNEYTGIYNILTKYHLNCITDGLLSMSGGIQGIFNIFEYGADLKYDEEKMQADIAKYGLFEYSDFAQYVSEDVYNMFPAAYFKVAIGKGYTTYEDLLKLADEYLVKHGYMDPIS